MNEMLEQRFTAVEGETDWVPGEGVRMYGAVACMAMDREATSATVELRLALEEQARELDAVLSRLAEARHLVPPRSDDGWRGLAQLFYDWALAGLESDLVAAQEHLTTAVRQTRRALENVGNRVG